MELDESKSMDRRDFILGAVVAIPLWGAVYKIVKGDRDKRENEIERLESLVDKMTVTGSSFDDYCRITGNNRKNYNLWSLYAKDYLSFLRIVPPNAEAIVSMKIHNIKEKGHFFPIVPAGAIYLPGETLHTYEGIAIVPKK